MNAPAFAQPAHLAWPCLIVPGIDNSGPDHWQSLWEYRLPLARRAELGSWDRPTRLAWRERLGRTIMTNDRPILIAAHSLGCLAVADWALADPHGAARHVLGALLVAPPDLDQRPIDPRLEAFAPWPRGRLPFPTVLAASRDDRYASFAASVAMAQGWGAELADCGHRGHINAQSGLGDWPDGRRLLARVARKCAIPGSAPSNA